MNVLIPWNIVGYYWCWGLDLRILGTGSGLFHRILLLLLPLLSLELGYLVIVTKAWSVLGMRSYCRFS